MYPATPQIAKLRVTVILPRWSDSIAPGRCERSRSPRHHQTGRYQGCAYAPAERLHRNAKNGEENGVGRDGSDKKPTRELDARFEIQPKERMQCAAHAGL